ncbi:hypothetical protein THAOC_37688 [Thalassiosira oceanica]|uniref:Uncharacterized protein n=1 Tax=Thalassiosira oceanica TaxID=159749 RepID=K0QY79_THAOC|nr:hypothetical protein THAOC_37688 [Thalassiosira oceanica]|eukprot:EJK43828.1 hypothetical protein THAOC_37688 [Thalassiosira oceanica]
MGYRAILTMAVTPHSAPEVRPFSSRGLYYDDVTRLTAIAEFPEVPGTEIDHRIQPYRPRQSATSVPMTIALAQICNRRVSGASGAEIDRRISRTARDSPGPSAVLLPFVASGGLASRPVRRGQYVEVAGREPYKIGLPSNLFGPTATALSARFTMDFGRLSAGQRESSKLP